MGIQVTPAMLRLMSAENQRIYGIELDPRSFPTENNEAWEQRQFAAWLKEKQLLPPAVWHSVAKRSTGTVGCPDFIVPVRGVVLWIEFKRPREELSPDQVLFARRLSEQGFTVFIARRYQEAIAKVEEYLL